MKTFTPWLSGCPVFPGFVFLFAPIITLAPVGGVKCDGHLVLFECHLLSCPGVATLGLKKEERPLLNPALVSCFASTCRAFFGNKNRHLKQGCPPLHIDHLPLLLHVAGTFCHFICEKWVARPSPALSPA